MAGRTTLAPMASITMTNPASDVVPDSQLEGDVVPDSQLQDEHQSGSAASAVKDYAVGLGKAGARMVAQGAIGAITFIPDIAVGVENLLPGGKDEMPSSFWNRKLDEILPPPESKVARALEFAGSALVAGPLGAEEAGERAAVKTAEELTGKEGAALGRVRTRAAEEAHTAGYNLPPAYIGGSVAKAIQSASGKARMMRDYRLENEGATDRLAKLSISMHPSEDLTESSLNRLEEEAYKHYQEVRDVGQISGRVIYKGENLTEQPNDKKIVDAFHDAVRAAGDRFRMSDGSYTFPGLSELKHEWLDRDTFDSSKLVDDIRTLRNASRLNLKTYKPENNAKGYVQRQVADAIEKLLDSKAAAGGNPKMLTLFRDARTRLAKINVIRDALVGDHVDAMRIKRMSDASPGRFTDGLKTIAETATYFPEAMKLESIKGEEGDWSVVDFLLGGSGVLTGHPEISATSAARPILRHMVERPSVQKKMIQNLRPSRSQRAVRAATRGVGNAVRPAAGAATRGAAILAPEQLAPGPDLGEQQQ